MNQSYNKMSTNSIRYSSRKPIFEGESSALANGDHEEFYRIIAKIRSLQDDVRIIIDQNQQIQTDNIYLKKLINDLQYSTTVQQDQIHRLTEDLSRQSVKENPIGKYQQQLKMLSKKVDFLHQQINDKHHSYQKLKAQKRSMQIKYLRVKQQRSELQFEQNELMQRINELLFKAFDKNDIRGRLEEKVMKIIEKCKELQAEISMKNKQLNVYRNNAQKQYNQQKQKRIQEEYHLELLKQRNQDFDKKRDFFKSCYNQDNIENVINQMLEKQHQIREEINYQLQREQILKEQKESAVPECQKRIARERALILQQLRGQRIQNDIAISQRQKALNDLQSVESSLAQIEEEGASIALENKMADSQNFKKISELQAQNVMLERQYSEVLQYLNMLKLQQQS